MCSITKTLWRIVLLWSVQGLRLASFFHCSSEYSVLAWLEVGVEHPPSSVLRRPAALCLGMPWQFHAAQRVSEKSRLPMEVAVKIGLARPTSSESNHR